MLNYSFCNNLDSQIFRQQFILFASQQQRQDFCVRVHDIFVYITTEYTGNLCNISGKVAQCKLNTEKIITGMHPFFPHHHISLKELPLISELFEPDNNAFQVECAGVEYFVDKVLFLLLCFAKFQKLAVFA